MVDTKDYGEFAKKLLASAQKGNAQSQYHLGVLYNDGKGVEKDYRQAASWYLKAAQQGHQKAQLYLGLLYQHGRGVARDYKQAAQWLRKSAEQGEQKAQYFLGVLYYKGIGVPKDLEHAAHWLEQSANQGNAEAQKLLDEILSASDPKSEDITPHNKGTDNSGNTEERTSSGSKLGTILAAIILLIVIATAGGGYYYFFMRTPNVHTEDVASSQSTQRYIVTAKLVPVLKNAEYVPPIEAPEEGWLLLEEEFNQRIALVLAYGDTIDGKLSQERDGFLKVGSGNSVFGFVELSALSPMPEYEAFAAPLSFQLEKNIVPCLLPGKYPISDYSDFVLPRGVVVMAEGSISDKNGREWLLCSFETDRGGEERGKAFEVLERYAKEHPEEEGTGWIWLAGSDHRYAWLPADEMKNLATFSPNLSKVERKNLPSNLSEEATKFIMKNGFYIDPSPVFQDFMDEDELINLYYPGVSHNETNFIEHKTPIFITADLPFHAFHFYFDHALKKAEEQTMLKRVRDLVLAMNEAFKNLPFDQSELGLRAKEKVSGFLELAQYLLTGNGNIDSIKGFANGIMKGEGWGENPFTELSQNFNLYAPRGHYALNEDLKAYFRSTYLLGMAWPLDTEIGAAATLILSKILERPNVKTLWHSLYDPTKALVGTSNNVNSPDEISEALKNFSINDLGKLSKVHDLMEALDKATKESITQKPAGMLNPSGKKFAVLPRRVTFDALIFHHLTFPATSTSNKMRILPDPLDAMAVLGSKPAQDEVKRYSSFKNYDTNQKALIEIWNKYSESEESKNGPAYILSAIRAYLTTNKSKQFFANSKAWGYRKLITAGAVMTELKHDVILYADRGGIGSPPDAGPWIAGSFKRPIPRHYLEPVPELYDALRVAAHNLEDTLKTLLPDEEDLKGEFYRTQLHNFEDCMKTLSDIAASALSDTMTYKDFMTLEKFHLPCVLPQGWDSGGKYWGADISDEDVKNLRMALIVDASTAMKEDIVKRGTPALYMAIGTPRKIQVYVNDRSGGWRLTEGYIYSYYNFEETASGHMDDKKWQDKIYNPEGQGELNKLLPYWYNRIYD